MILIKLEAGQAWACSEDTNIRVIKHVSVEHVIYDVFNSVGSLTGEHATDIRWFIKTNAKKLLPCWPPKPKIRRAQAVFAGDTWPYSPRHWFKDKEDAQKYSDSKIIEFPLNDMWKEFDE